MRKKVDDKQKRFLEELEKGLTTTDVLFQEHAISSDELDAWLKSRTFMRGLDDMRKRMKFRLDQDLCRGAMIAAARLSNAVAGYGGIAKPAEVQACVNAIKLCEAVVGNPKLKRE